MLKTKTSPDEINKEIKNLEDSRDEIITLSIKLTRESKILIYAVISGNMEKAENTLDIMENIKNELLTLLKNYTMFWDNGKIGLQEYVEAVLFYEFIKSNKILDREYFKDIPLNEYLSGLMDFFGEALRYSVDQLSKNNIQIVEIIYQKLMDVYRDFLLNLEIKNYDLRRKLDYVNNILRRFSEYILEYKIHKS